MMTFKLPIALCSAFIVSGCVYRQNTDDYGISKIDWYRPFQKTDTVVYVSKNNEVDTIIFHGVTTSRDSTSGFEQGTSKTVYLTVPYEFSKGSYHQFAIMGDGVSRYEQDVLKFAKSTSGYHSMEIIFIRTIFGDETLRFIEEIDSNTYFFDSNKANYSRVNVEKGLQSFTLSTMIGIVQHVDVRGVKWTRK